MLSLSSGHSARYLTDAVATGRENYYTGAVAEGEPPGRWYGAGAAKLGLSGVVDAQDMEALYGHFVHPFDPAFKDPSRWGEASKLGHSGYNLPTAEEIYQRLLEAEPDADAERREQLRVQASKAERHNVAFFDATFSVQKSVTVLHTAFEAQEVKARNAGRLEEAEAWGRYKQAVEEAIWAGNRAALDYLAEHAGYCRVGRHGGSAGRWADAHEWTVASFFQHDSRDHDPQLHVHNAILNRVQGPDGKWRTLDGRSLYAFRPAAAAVGERTMEEHLTRVLGVEFRTRPDGKAREIVGIPQHAMDLFSSRRRAITPKQAELIAEFKRQHGRAPNALERDRLAQQATLATRQAKSHTGQTRAQMLREWDARLRAEVGASLTQVAHQVLSLRTDPSALPEPVAFSPLAVIETALAAVQAKQAAWTEPDLVREISNALPDNLGITDGRELAALLDGLTAKALRLAVPLEAAKPGDEVLPEVFRLANGASAFEAPGRRRYATPAHLHTERLLRAATAVRDATVAARSEDARRFLEQMASSGLSLGPDQAAAVTGVLTSGARVESLVGPAGTGKSFVVGALARAWSDPGMWSGAKRRVFGLATAQIAAEVLAGEGVEATNTARWLACQDRLACGRASAEDAHWELRAGDLVVVDESSMADTAALSAVHRRVEAAGAKMLLVGDHRQLGAVGAGGAMAMVAEIGNAYELAEARRFTHAWEREASLRLRACDPSALAEYYKNGRIIDAGTIERAEQDAALAWLADTLAGKHAVLVVDTNEQVARINAQLRGELVRLGKVAEHGVRLGRDGTWAGVGDIVQARCNGWHLAGHDGNRRGPINREQYRVIETRDDGSLVVTPINTKAGDGAAERMTLPASYVAEHLTLGYAVTVHAAEGVTADVGHEIVTSNTRANALYPGATRGRESNTLHVVTQAAPAGDDAETGDTAHAPRRDPRAVLEEILEAADPERSATATAAEAAAKTANVQTPAERFTAACEIAIAERTTRWFDELVDSGQLTAHERRRLAAEDAGRKLSPLLRRVELAGHDPRAVLIEAITQHTLDGSRQISNVLHTRITNRELPLDPQGARYADWTPHTGDPQWDRYLGKLAEAADARRDELGAQAAEHAPAWAVQALGPVPDDPGQRAGWVERAGQVAVYRELVGHDDPTEALGPAPKPGLIEPYTAWRSAWRALGQPDARRDEREMTDGQLRMRIRAYEREQAWAPRNVTGELANTIQAADHHRRTATLRAAAAQAATNPDERARLEQEAAGAAALAASLDRRVEVLRELDHARNMWLAHTAATRAAADRARAELANRHASDPEPDQQVTAAEWLQAHRDAMAEEDAYRDITETDLIDAELADLAGEVLPADELSPLVDLPEDVRAVASREPAPADEDPATDTAAATAESVRRAQRALYEIKQRDLADAARAQEEEAARAERVARWQADEQQPTRTRQRHPLRRGWGR